LYPTEKESVGYRESNSGTRFYVNQRTSSSYLASTIPSLRRAFSYPGVWVAGLLIAVALAFGAILLEAPIEWLKRQIKSLFSRLTGYLKPKDRGSRFWKILGVRADVLPFLLFGQLVASLNAPLDALPSLQQLLLGCVYGAIAALIIHAITKMPEIRLHRKAHHDSGEMRAQWLSIGLAVLAVGIGHLLGVVPGLVVGIYSARHFRKELSQRNVAAGAWQLSLLLVLLSTGSWFALDFIGEAVADPSSPIRAVTDAVLGTLVIAGSQGLVWTLINPAEDSSRTLRKVSLVKWFAALAGGVMMVVAILINGGAEAGIFSPDSTLEQLQSLLITGVVLLVILFVAHAIASRRRSSEDLSYS
jgi:hypothetical protein